MTKKILSIVLAVSMVLTMCLGILPVSAAEGAVTISGGDENNLVTGNAGDEIAIPVYISGNTAGINKFMISLIYDENYIIPVTDPAYDPDTNPGATDLGLVKGELNFPVCISNPFGEDEESGKKAVRVQGVNIVGNITGDGLLFGYKFIVNESLDTRASTDVAVKVEEITYDNGGLGSENREVADIKDLKVTINQDLPLKEQNVTVPDLTAKTYGDEAFSWACTPDSEANLTDASYSSSNTSVATIDAETGMVTIVGKGTTDLTVTIEGNDAYADFSATRTLTVNPINITVTADNKTKRVGEADPVLTYTYNEDALLEGDELTGALTREGDDTVGSHAIVEDSANPFMVVNSESQEENENYEVTVVPGTLEITEKTPQNIVVADFGAKTYGDAPFTIEVTPDPTSNLENFSYASSDESVATVSEDGTVTILGATDEEGITITVTEAGNDEYAQTSIEKTLVVAKAPLEITLAGKTITYGEELGEFEITYDGFVNEETEADLLTPVEISGVPEDVNAGTYPLTLEGATSNNYEITYVGADLVVNPRAVEIATIGVFNKEADETTDAVINPSTITMTEGKGFLAGDDAFVNIVSYTAAFEDAEAGVDKAVTLSDVVAEVTGNDKNNYTISVADSALATTATIYAAGEMTAQDVADQIGGYIPVAADDETLTLPEVPEGFTIAINTSSNEEVIDPATGAIRHTDKDEEVKLTFTVTKESDSSTATTGEITVTVPKGTNKTVSIAVNGNGTLEGDIGSQPIGSEITIIAVPDDGYQVSEWFVNGESIGRAGQTSYTFVLEDDITIGVAFTKRPGGLPSTGTGPSTSVKAPTASVRSGSTVFKGSVIELSTTTSGASIYYTTDGSTPTTSNGTLYTVDGIRISGDVTIKAFATKDSKSSTVATFSYTMKTANAEFKEDANTIKYMESVSDTLFEPDRDATRYEVLEALDALMDIEDANIENGFSDVTEEYEELVNKFAATDIVDGYPNLTFGGTSSITRAEFVKMLAEALNLDMSGAAEHNFNDVQAGHWAESYIAAFTELGYIIGDPDGNFRPDDNITRAEVVTVINRILDVESDPDAEQKYTDLAPEHWAYGYVMAVAKDKE